jgi:hypothetical protein
MRPRLVSLLVLASFALLSFAAPVGAQTTPPEPSSPEPQIPAAGSVERKPAPQVINQIVHDDTKAPSQAGIKRPQRIHHARRVTRHYLVRHEGRPPLERPALAGVALVEPLPAPPEPPHITVPVPAYPLESLAAAFTTPPPPIVCEPTRRDPTAPDPHLYKEAPVACAPDNP